MAVNQDAESIEECMFQLETVRPTLVGNVLGLPSVAVPAGLVDGLPVGVLLTGSKWSDLNCLSLAQCIEDAKLLKSILPDYFHILSSKPTPE